MLYLHDGGAFDPSPPTAATPTMVTFGSGTLATWVTTVFPPQVVPAGTWSFQWYTAPTTPVGGEPFNFSFGFIDTDGGCTPLVGPWYGVMANTSAGTASTDAGAVVVPSGVTLCFEIQNLYIQNGPITLDYDSTSTPSRLILPTLVPSDAGPVDAGSEEDSGSLPTDAGVSSDGGIPDAGASAVDAGTTDAGTDGGPTADAGTTPHGPFAADLGCTQAGGAIPAWGCIALIVLIAIRRR